MSGIFLVNNYCERAHLLACGMNHSQVVLCYKTKHGKQTSRRKLGSISPPLLLLQFL